MWDSGFGGSGVGRRIEGSGKQVGGVGSTLIRVSD